MLKRNTKKKKKINKNETNKKKHWFQHVDKLQVGFKFCFFFFFTDTINNE